MLKFNRISFYFAAIFIFFFSGPAYSAYEIIKSDLSPLSFIDVTTNSYSACGMISGSNASANELKTSTTSMLTGYLSQIPSILLEPSISGIAGAPLTTGVKAFGFPPVSAPEIIFSNEISTPTISSSTIKVLELFDHLGNQVSREWEVTINYDPAEKSLTINPVSGSWPEGSTFSVNFSSAINDINNIPFLNPTTAYFTTLMNPATDNTIRLIESPTTGVHINADSYKENFFVKLSSYPGLNIEEANRKLKQVIGMEKYPLKILNAGVYNSSGATLSGTSIAARIFFYYGDLDADGNGILDISAFQKLKTQNLSVWRLNEGKKLWIRQSGYRLNNADKEVELDTSHFSIYSLVPLADYDVTNAYAYPVPFKPNAGNPQRYGTWSGGITFTNLPSEGKIRIYTLSMRLVRTLEITPNEIKWDAKNNAGETVASGIYIWEIVSGNNRKSGKLMIIR